MLNWLAEFLRDIRFGVRHLAKSPGFTSIAVFSLALGIMATTAIYSVIHAVVLDPFPYKDVDNLMSVRVWDPGQRGYRLSHSTDQFLEIAERNTIFEGVIASTISRRGAWLLLIGVAVGLAGSFLTARLLARQIWNVSPFDPITFIADSLILLIAGLQACLWPARRAARIDPIVALRQE